MQLILEASTYSKGSSLWCFGLNGLHKVEDSGNFNTQEVKLLWLYAPLSDFQYMKIPIF